MVRRIVILVLIVLGLLSFLFENLDEAPPGGAPSPPTTEAEAPPAVPLPPETPAPPAPEEARRSGDPDTNREDGDKGRSLGGRVVRLDGTPVAGAVVAISTRYTDLFREHVRPHFGIDRQAARVRTGKDGAFRFDPDTPHRIQCSDWQSRMLVRAETEDGASYYTELAGHMEDLKLPDLVIREAIFASGIVEDAQGVPVPTAKVSLRFVHGVGPRGKGGEQFLTVADTSDESGRVRFCPVPRRDDWDIDVEVEHRRYLEVDREITLADLDTELPFRIVLAAGLTVRGTLLMADGRPAGGYRVHVGRRGTNLRLMAVTKTAKDGSFEARGVPPKGGAVGFDSGWNELRHKVDVPAGEEGGTVDLGEVRLPGGGTVRGVVHDEEGKPVRCHVTARSSGSYSGFLYARWNRDEPGFTIAKVTPGTYVIQARMDLGEGDEIRGELTGVKPGDGDVVVKLTRAYSVLFVFHRAEKPDAPFEVRSPEIRMGYGSWSGGGAMTRKRIYPGSGDREIRFTVKVAGFEDVELEPLRPRSDREVVAHVYLVAD